MAGVNWAEAWSIVGRGVGVVFAIMSLLAIITSLMGRIIQKSEAKRKAAAKAEAEAGGGDQ